MAALTGLALLSSTELSAEERAVPPELLAKLAASSSRFEAMLKRASFTVTGTMSNLSSDGAVSGTKEGKFRLRAGGDRAKVDVIKYAEDGEDKTAEAKKKAEQRAKGPKKPKKADEEVHMPFLDSERPKYDFRLGEADPRDPARVMIHFRAKAPAQNLMNGSAWVDARTGHVLTASVAASETSTFVDYLRARLEFGERTPMGPAVSKVSFEGAGGILFLRKRFRGSASFSSYELAP